MRLRGVRIWFTLGLVAALLSACTRANSHGAPSAGTTSIVPLPVRSEKQSTTSGEFDVTATTVRDGTVPLMGVDGWVAESPATLSVKVGDEVTISGIQVGHLTIAPSGVVRMQGNSLIVISAGRLTVTVQQCGLCRPVGGIQPDMCTLATVEAD